MTSKQYKFLKLIYRHGASTSKIQKHFPDYLNEPDFFDSFFQQFFYSQDGMFYITTFGKIAYETRYTSTFRFYIPVILSVVALFLSIISICLQYL